MKNINFNTIILTLVSIFLVLGCESPLEDELKVINESQAFVKDITYTMTDDDYELVDDTCDCAGFGSFSSEDDVKANIPIVLNSVFPGLGNGSSALVTYDFFRGFNAPEAEVWVDAASDSRYTLVAADYTSVSAGTGAAGFFNNSTRAEDNLSNILKANITTPSDGDVVAVTYKKSTSEYSNFTLLENFNSGDLKGVDTTSAVGDEGWEWDSSSSGYNYAGMSGFGGTDNEDWLVTPQLDLTARASGTTTLRLRHVLAFIGDATVIGTDISVRVSTNHTTGANPAAAAWTDITAQFDQFPTGSGADFNQYDSRASLAAYEGQNIHIAFFYHSDEDNTPLWRVIDVSVDNGTPVSVTNENAFYTYNESTNFWTPSGGDGYFVTEADFESMGVFLNFGSDVPADDYLPQFLTSRYPVALEGDERVMVYDYVSSSSGAQIRSDFYTFTSGAWTKWESTVANSFNFGHDGTGWAADNTIKYTLGPDDWTAIAAATLTSNPGGSASITSFGNFDLTLWTSDQIFTEVTARLAVIFPSPEAGQKYSITYAVWRPGSGTDTINIIWDGSAYALNTGG